MSKGQSAKKVEDQPSCVVTREMASVGVVALEDGLGSFLPEHLVVRVYRHADLMVRRAG
jgi:hypothetical protein